MRIVRNRYGLAHGVVNEIDGIMVETLCHRVLDEFNNVRGALREADKITCKDCLAEADQGG